MSKHTRTIKQKPETAGSNVHVLHAPKAEVAVQSTVTYWPMARPDGMFYVRQVGQELYENDVQAVWELVRNGFTAGMARDAKEWSTDQAAHVEVWLETGHPLCLSGTLLLVKDNGRSFTPEDVERYCNPGGNKGARYGGASHKQIGRFAGYKINSKAGPENHGEGFYLFIRTTPTGPVTFAYICPRLHNEDKTAETRQIADTDPLIPARYRGIIGSFTIVAVPNAVVEVKELCSGLAPYLPRKVCHRLHIKVQGIPLEPLPLPKKMLPLLDCGDIHADLKDGRRLLEEGGLWLCDAQSGLPVAHLPHVPGAPDPTSRLDLTGCIYWPNLLGNQDTTRRGLRGSYLRSKEGKKLLEILGLSSVAEFCNRILGNRNVLDGQLGDLVTRFSDLARTAFGPPTPTADVIPPPPPKQPVKPPGPPPGPGTGGPPGPDKPPTVRRGETIKIGNKQYVLVPLPTKQGVFFAELHPGRNSIQLNAEYPPFKLLSTATQAALAFEDILRAAATDQRNSDRARAEALTEWWTRLLQAGDKTAPKSP